MAASTIRTKDQLAVLLKLVEVNQVGLTRRNMSIRQRIWQVITQKLNEMQGAEKDVEGWKRSYNSWRLSTGKYFEEEKERIIKDVADDDYFVINVTEEEVANEHDYDDGVTFLDPKDRQLTRLHELINKQRLLVISTSEEDEPLRQRLWQNIAEELNDIPNGIKLPKEEWKKRVDLRQYAAKRGRKRKKFGKSIKTYTVSKPDIEGDVRASESYNAYEEYIIEDYKPVIGDETTSQSDTTHTIEAVPNDVFAEIDDNDSDDNTDDIIKLLNEPHTRNDTDNFPFDIYEAFDTDVDDCNFESNTTDVAGCRRAKREKLTPIVQSFKFSNRITTAVEQLKEDVKETKEILKQTTELLNRMCNIMEERNKKQDETNVLLKRNGQMLKILVEYKCGMRVKGKT
ncbi:uncharacterized protein [Eurosta solidaginis]|uniref:uncharacterized protein n=1 Tax=Eurosta solidaginis TaxID=178769 RepID=UPI003530AD02